MKYGKLLCQHGVQEYWANYVRYKELKQYIAALVSGVPGSENTSGFAALVLEELQRVNEFARVLLSDVLQGMEALHTWKAASAPALDNMIDATSYKIACFDAYTWHNAEALRKIVKKFEKKTHASATWFTMIQDDQYILQSRRIIHSLVVQFSRSVWAARHTSGLLDKGLQDATWTPPEVFERFTRKFWVRLEYVPALKLMIAKHLQILEMHKPTVVPDLDFDDHIEDFALTKGCVTSLYLDNPDAGLPCYHARVAQEEGAHLVRVRWYGTPQLHHDGLTLRQEYPRRLGPDGNVFVEIKVHHEEWSGLQSRKQRFKMENKQLAEYFDLSKPLGPSSTSDRAPVSTPPTKGSKPRRTRLFPVKSAKVAESPVAIQQQQEDLRSEIYRLVHTGGLRPVLLTECHRTAFQRPDENLVRMTLDCPLTGCGISGKAARGGWRPREEEVKEPWGAAPLGGSEGFSWDHWLSGGAAPRPEACPEPFPFAVLEVKLQQDPPPAWLVRFIQTCTDNHIMRCVEKYSKFQHVVNQVFGKEGAGGAGTGPVIRQSPEWVSQATGEGAVPFADEPMVACWELLQPTVRRPTLVSGVPAKTLDEAESGTAANVTVDKVGAARPGPRPSFVDRQITLRAFAANIRGSANTIPRDKKVRVEPKTFFANERTFIQWAGAAMFIYGVATALFTVTSAGGGPVSMDTLLGAWTLSAVALLLLVYAAVIFYMRVNRLQDKQNSVVYSDRLGPGMLALILVVAVSGLLGRQIWSYTRQPSAPRVLVADVPTYFMHADSWAYTQLPYQPTRGRANVTRNEAHYQLFEGLASWKPSSRYLLDVDEGSHKQRVYRVRRFQLVPAATEAPASGGNTASMQVVQQDPAGEGNSASILVVQKTLQQATPPEQPAGGISVLFQNGALDFQAPPSRPEYHNGAASLRQVAILCDPQQSTFINKWTVVTSAAAGNSTTGLDPAPLDQLTDLDQYFVNITSRAQSYLGTDTPVTMAAISDSYIWEASFNLTLGNATSSLVWSVEYPTLEQAAGGTLQPLGPGHTLSSSITYSLLAASPGFGVGTVASGDNFLLDYMRKSSWGVEQSQCQAF